MGIIYEDAVMVKEADKPGDHTVITVNCPDKTGLGCDLCRIILLFGLCIARGDASTDGKWCYIVFWVVSKPATRWDLLKKRILEVCPTFTAAESEIYYYIPEFQQPKQPDVFLLKFWCDNDRKGLLHDISKALCKLELTIKRVKVSTAPDGRVMDLFFVTDTRELLHTKKRREEVIWHLKAALEDPMLPCEIELAGPEITACSRGFSFLPSSITEEMFSLELSAKYTSGFLGLDSVSVIVDNSLSPSHTLVQIVCQDHKGLIYDVMRTLKDYNIQVNDLNHTKPSLVSSF
ncbi:unnamed protein product [Ilex paraguariensis]|uniref:ACT domain-containing protein ACR n=1 Tax=Ilex paraguariensis TaxID=185542 RepID=A0ABC8RDH2_9AQUA